MRILVSAYACEPGRGSEPGVGWNCAKEMSRRHSLAVLTRANNRTAIEGAGEDWTKSVRWLYYDPPRWLTFWKRGGRGVQLFYLIWQIGAARFVRRRFGSGDFDAVHHVTFGKYWIPTFVDLPGIPVVFGPVGGGEETPPAFRGTFSFRGRVAERAKKAASWLLPRLPGVRAAYRRMSLCLAATDQTAEKLKRLVPCPVVVFPQSAVSAEDAAAMRGIADAAARSPSPLFVTACRLDHWKAVRLAVEAFASFLRDHPGARLVVLGNGPEEKPLRDLVSRMGLSEGVSFPGRLPALRDVYERIASATALLHPALHEAFGQACLESFALRTPVVCWDWGGPGLICRRNGFDAVPLADSAADSVEAFRRAMDRCWAERPDVALSDGFLWSSWCDSFFERLAANGLVRGGR